MKWVETSRKADVLLRELDAQNKDDRWEQHPHMTELIYCLTKSYYNRFMPLPATRKELGFFVLGLGLQQALIGHRESVVGECEGIHYEIDFLDGGSVGELKTTRMALTKEPNDWSDGWKKQLLGYLKAQGTTHAAYYVLYVIPPELKAWEVEATQEEIDENWAWLLGRKAIYDGCVESRQPPRQFMYCEPWECKDCRYKLICDARGASHVDVS